MTLLTFASTFLAALLTPKTARAVDADTTGIGAAGPTSLAMPTPVANSPEAKEEWGNKRAGFLERLKPVPSGLEGKALAVVDQSTGAAEVSYKFALPAARGEAQPSLAIQYNSHTGPGVAGMGWSLNLPSIVRKGHAGLPRFQDAVFLPTAQQSDPNTDDYYVDGKLLVPYPGLFATPPAALPTGGNPWVAFNTEVFDGARYFFNGQTWVKQTKSGHYLQFGNLLNNVKFGVLDGGGTEIVDGITAAVGTAKAVGDPSLNPIYRWNLVADADATGNTVYYVWNNNSLLLGFPGNNGTGNGQNFLMDIYDTSSQIGASLSAPIPANATFAHHVHLTWTKGLNAATQLTTVLSNPPWRAPPYALLTTVDVTSATWGSTTRELVREYRLGYTANSSGTQAFLNTVTEVGDCAEATSVTGASTGGVKEDSAGFIEPPAVSGCRSLPPMTYTYTGVNLLAGSPGSLGFAASPVKSPSFVDVAQVLGTWDINGDGAADFVGWHTVSPISYINYPGGLPSALLVNPPPLSFQLGGQSAAGFTTGSPTYLNSRLTFSQIQAAGILGDWASTGALTMLVMEPPNVRPSCSSSNTITPNSSPFVYTFTPPTAGHTSSLQGMSAVAGALTSGDVSRLETLIVQSTQTCLADFDGAGHNGPAYSDWTQPSRAADVDSDGLPDYQYLDRNSPTNGPRNLVAFSTKDRFGQVHPFASNGSSVCNAQCNKLGSLSTPYQCPSSPLIGNPVLAADVDGNGLADMVIPHPDPNDPNRTVLDVYQGRGDGRFGVGTEQPAAGDAPPYCTHATFGGPSWSYTTDLLPSPTFTDLN